MFGRVNVTNQGVPVNYACRLHFKDLAARPNNTSPDLSAGVDDVPEQSVPLDTSGWVFNTLRVGATYRISVACELGSPQYYVSYSPKPFVFRPLGGNTISYFGEFSVELHADRQIEAALGRAAAEVLVGRSFGIFGQGLASIGAGDDAEHTLYDSYSDAVLVYDARYALRARSLSTVSVLDKRFVTGVNAFQGSSKRGLGGHGEATRAGVSSDGPVAVSPMPWSLGGFNFGKTLEELQAVCVAAGRSYSPSGTAKATCSGAPNGGLTDVLLTAWFESSRSIRINVSASPEMAWQQRLDQHAQLTKRFRELYGNVYSRKTMRLDGCERKLAECLREGQAHTTVRWRWRDGRTISLTLDPRPIRYVPPIVTSSDPSTANSSDASTSTP